MCPHGRKALTEVNIWLITKALLRDKFWLMWHLYLFPWVFKFHIRRVIDRHLKWRAWLWMRNLSVWGLCVTSPGIEPNFFSIAVGHLSPLAQRYVRRVVISEHVTQQLTYKRFVQLERPSWRRDLVSCFKFRAKVNCPSFNIYGLLSLKNITNM
jgi:hypothetical protein